MSVGGATEPRIHPVLTFFDMEAASVVSVMLGIVQVLLSAPLYYVDIGLPKNLFILPLLIGILILVAGSFGLANVRSPSRYLRQGCAYSNVAGLLAAVVASCIYGFAVRSVEEVDCPDESKPSEYYAFTGEHCNERKIAELFCSVTTLLLCYNVGVLLLHGLLSIISIRALRSP